MRALRLLLRPIHRFLIVRTTVADPWEIAPTFGAALNPGRFGAGSTRPFAWYLEGKSTVKVASIEEIVQWLVACEYAADPDLFHEADYWQHPKTFEQLRRGDCEDHAIWAWRKLIELGVAASFYVGQRQPDRPDARHHAWVVFERAGESYLLEAVDKDLATALQPLQHVRSEYVPHYSVNRSCRIEARAGLIAYWRQVELKRRAARSGAGSAA